MICPTPDLRDLYVSVNDQFRMIVVLDGINSSDVGNIDVKPDPRMENIGTIRFQYPFEDTISLRVCIQFFRHNF